MGTSRISGLVLGWLEFNNLGQIHKSWAKSRNHMIVRDFMKIEKNWENANPGQNQQNEKSARNSKSSTNCSWPGPETRRLLGSWARPFMAFALGYGAPCACACQMLRACYLFAHAAFGWPNQILGPQFESQLFTCAATLLPTHARTHS